MLIHIHINAHLPSFVRIMEHIISGGIFKICLHAKFWSIGWFDLKISSTSHYFLYKFCEHISIRVCQYIFTHISSSLRLSMCAYFLTIYWYHLFRFEKEKSTELDIGVTNRLCHVFQMYITPSYGKIYFNIIIKRNKTG